MRTDLRLHLSLIAELDELFPLRNPQQTDSIDAIRFTSGQRSVVEFLKAQLEEQQLEVSILKGDHDV